MLGERRFLRELESYPENSRDIDSVSCQWCHLGILVIQLHKLPILLQATIIKLLVHQTRPEWHYVFDLLPSLSCVNKNRLQRKSYTLPMWLLGFLSQPHNLQGWWGGAGPNPSALSLLYLTLSVPRGYVSVVSSQFPRTPETQLCHISL